MKIQREHFFGARLCAERQPQRVQTSAAGLRHSRAPRRSEDGMATVLFIALLAIMLILVTAESRALWQLHREVKFLQQQQIKRLNVTMTNTVSTATSEIK
jgi:hypothetical protein